MMMITMMIRGYLTRMELIDWWMRREWSEGWEKDEERDGEVVWEGEGELVGWGYGDGGPAVVVAGGSTQIFASHTPICYPFFYTKLNGGGKLYPEMW